MALLKKELALVISFVVVDGDDFPNPHLAKLETVTGNCHGSLLPLEKDSYICNMATLNIEILNPKAKKLLQNLAELRLISISEKTSNSFMEVIKKLRSKKYNISLGEISKEVEAVRSKRYGK